MLALVSCPDVPGELAAGDDTVRQVQVADVQQGRHVEAVACAHKDHPLGVLQERAFGGDLVDSEIGDPTRKRDAVAAQKIEIYMKTGDIFTADLSVYGHFLAVQRPSGQNDREVLHIHQLFATMSSDEFIFAKISQFRL